MKNKIKKHKGNNKRIKKNRRQKNRIKNKFLIG